MAKYTFYSTDGAMLSIEKENKIESIVYNMLIVAYFIKLKNTCYF